MFPSRAHSKPIAIEMLPLNLKLHYKHGGWQKVKTGRAVTLFSSFCNTQLTCPFFSLAVQWQDWQDWEDFQDWQDSRNSRTFRMAGLVGLIGLTTLARLADWQDWQDWQEVLTVCSSLQTV